MNHQRTARLFSEVWLILPQEPSPHAHVRPPHANVVGFLGGCGGRLGRPLESFPMAASGRAPASMTR